MAGPVPSAGPHLGRVASFDAGRGLGTVADDAGARHTEFHATAIADGSRRIEPGTEVSFVVPPGHRGRYEARVARVAAERAAGPCTAPRPRVYQMVPVRREAIGGVDGTAGDRPDGDGDGADPARSIALLADGSTWPEWSPIGSFELVEPGDGAPEGWAPSVSSRTGRRHKSRERVVERTPGRGFSYVLEAGLPCATTWPSSRCAPSTGGGTTISWRSTFRAKVPGTGWLYRRQLGEFIGQTVERAGRAAGRPAPRPRVRSGRQAGPSLAALSAGGALGPSRLDEGQAELGERLEECGSASPRRPLRPSSRQPRPSMARRAWKSIGRRLRQVDGGQLEEPVAVVGHHDLGRRAGQLRPAWPRPRPGPRPRSGAAP